MFKILTLFLFYCSITWAQNADPNAHFTRSNLDTIPKYEGGEFTFADYLVQQFRVSQSIKNGNVGNSFSTLISFDIDVDGTTSNVNVENCSNAYIANELKRICTQTPGWTSGYLYGSTVKSRIYVPFSFVLNEDHILYQPINDQLIAKTGKKKATGLKVLLLGGTIALFAGIFSLFG